MAEPVRSSTAAARPPVASSTPGSAGAMGGSGTGPAPGTPGPGILQRTVPSASKRAMPPPPIVDPPGGSRRRVRRGRPRRARRTDAPSGDGEVQGVRSPVEPQVAAEERDPVRGDGDEPALGVAAVVQHDRSHDGRRLGGASAGAAVASARVAPRGARRRTRFIRTKHASCDRSGRGRRGGTARAEVGWGGPGRRASRPQGPGRQPRRRGSPGGERPGRDRRGPRGGGRRDPPAGGPLGARHPHVRQGPTGERPRLGGRIGSETRTTARASPTSSGRTRASDPPVTSSRSDDIRGRAGREPHADWNLARRERPRSRGGSMGLNETSPPHRREAT